MREEFKTKHDKTKNWNILTKPHMVTHGCHPATE